MEIVKTTFVDLCPKLILLTIVKNTDDFIAKGKLSATLLDMADDESTLGELVRPVDSIVDR